MVHRYTHPCSRHVEPWLTAWTWRGHVYTVANMAHPTFWRHVRTMWRGHVWYGLWWWLRHPIARWW